jgi:hypothetical protein
MNHADFDDFRRSVILPMKWTPVSGPPGANL